MKIEDALRNGAYKKFNKKESEEFCALIRQKIIDSVRENGGHLSSNLGVVELTVAINSVFDYEKDKIIFDVGHQCYTQKILSGRCSDFEKLRQKDGISGFPDMLENENDCFSAGHSSTSVSAGSGLAKARDILHGDYSVVSVFGDGALGGGQIFEALNNITEMRTRQILILNDNGMSISRNVGALTAILSRFRVLPGYTSFKKGFSKFIAEIPLIGKPVYKFFRAIRDFFSRLLIRDDFFRNFGVKYIGTVDGHNVIKLRKCFERAKKAEGPVLIHVLTKKGKGFSLAEKKPDLYHGLSPSFSTLPSVMSLTVGNKLVEIAKRDSRVVAITAAMTSGTCLNHFKETFHQRFFDVGIAEEHAVTFAAGLCRGGLKPYFAVYSTFLQRGFDQLLNDVCIQNIPIVLLVDRAGLGGQDGKTHHGMFDVSYLSMMPNMTVISPKDRPELEKALEFSLNFNSPLAIRYGTLFEDDIPVEIAQIVEDITRWEYVFRNAKSEYCVIAYSNYILSVAIKAAKSFVFCNKICVVNARTVKPIDKDFLNSIRADKILVIDDCVLSGSLFESILAHYNSVGVEKNIKSISFGDCFIRHGDKRELYADVGISVDGICEKLCELGDIGKQSEVGQQLSFAFDNYANGSVDIGDNALVNNARGDVNGVNEEANGVESASVSNEKIMIGRLRNQ